MKKLLFIISILFIGHTIQAQTCTPQIDLSWSLPAGFDSTYDRIIVLAKKKGDTIHMFNGGINDPYIVYTTPYIDQGVPTQDPFTYGIGDTNLTTTDGVIPDSVKYENDPLALVVYNGIGTNVSLTYHSEDSIFSFAVFNVDSGVYSNAVLGASSLIIVPDVCNAVAAPGRVQWIPFGYEDAIMVVVKKDDPISGSPSGDYLDYLTGVDDDFTASTSYFNGTDDTDGKVVFLFVGDRFSLQGLGNAVYYVKIYVTIDGCWSHGYERKLDNTIKF